MSTRNPRVHGIGGIFFKARDPAALSAWYGRHLDFNIEAWGGALFSWNRPGGATPACTVWSPFAADTGYFQPSAKDFMLNLRVDDLDAVLAALRDEGCRVLDRREEGEQGKFGYVLDPEDNLLELWQPASDDPSLAQSP
jgi:catechol 2,3-dioxygenase-like lactoylglutathione lyase family enzyme